MKYVYVVLAGSYDKNPAVVCQHEEDAKTLAESLHPKTDSDDLDEFVIPVPYLCNDHDTYNVDDIIMTAIVSTKKIYDDLVSTAFQNKVQPE